MPKTTAVKRRPKRKLKAKPKKTAAGLKCPVGAFPRKSYRYTIKKGKNKGKRVSVRASCSKYHNKDGSPAV